MSGPPVYPVTVSGALSGGTEFGAEVLSHLAAQIGSAERLLAVVLEQGAAIKAKDVHGVVRLAGLLHGELSRREALDEQRAILLRHSGQRLGVAAEAVTITALAQLMGAAQAAQASARSAELRGLLAELQREHLINRALMKVQLAFLDHLFATLALDRAPAYDSSGLSGSDQRRTVGGSGLHVLDLEA
jgi:hypothetical protein